MIFDAITKYTIVENPHPPQCGVPLFFRWVVASEPLGTPRGLGIFMMTPRGVEARHHRSVDGEPRSERPKVGRVWNMEEIHGKNGGMVGKCLKMTYSPYIYYIYV